MRQCYIEIGFNDHVTYCNFEISLNKQCDGLSYGNDIWLTKVAFLPVFKL